MYSDTTEGKRVEVLRHANMENTFRHYEDIVFSFPGKRLAHIQINGRYNKRFHLEKASASGCHADKPGGADYYWLRLR